MRIILVVVIALLALDAQADDDRPLFTEGAVASVTLGGLTGVAAGVGLQSVITVPGTDVRAWTVIASSLSGLGLGFLAGQTLTHDVHALSVLLGGLAGIAGGTVGLALGGLAVGLTLRSDGAHPLAWAAVFTLPVVFGVGSAWGVGRAVEGALRAGKLAAAQVNIVPSGDGAIFALSGRF